MIFRKQTQRKSIFDEFTKKLRERAAMDPKTRKDGNLNYLFLVYDRDKNEISHYSAYTTNSNYPELIEMLIWEHLVDISEDELTEDEVRAHYNWMMYKISELAAKRLERGYKNSEGCKEA